MRKLLTFFKWVFRLGLVAVAALAGWLYMAPPDLIRVGSAYSAKMVCSNVFLAGRDAEEVLNHDVQAPGHPLLKLMRLDVDQQRKTVTAGLFGVFGNSTAILRDGLGCTSVPDADVEAARRVSLAAAPAAPVADALWPDGGRVEVSQDPALREILDDAALTGPGMRAVVIVRNGRIVGERYGEGFSEQTPLLGWSMTKTVTAAIIGTLVKAGKIATDGTGLVDDWKADARQNISVADLMAMSSGLAFNEEYGDVTDVTRMLFLEADMAGFAAAQPLAGGIGKAWSYSSGTTLILSRLWQMAAGADALAWPRQALFAPLGMTSAVLETDEAGTFVGSSYLYATARDWARFGQFLLQDGVWGGQAVLPPGFVGWMREAAPASGGEYGRGQLWLHGSGKPWSPAAGQPDIPADAYWLLGHDGQTITVIPSKGLVVLRMGLTPSKLGYQSQALVAAVAAAAAIE